MLLMGVPKIRQESSMSCWHASARMLYGYKRRASINPLPAAYTANAGLTGQQFIALAKTVGLRTVPQVNQSFDWSYLDNLLRVYGPIWAAGRWNGFPHIIVIVGAFADGKIAYIDPADGLQHGQDMKWFNEKIASEVAIPMMYLP